MSEHCQLNFVIDIDKLTKAEIRGGSTKYNGLSLRAVQIMDELKTENGQPFSTKRKLKMSRC